MHAELLPVGSGGREGGGGDVEQHGLQGYSHFGEFQALMRKWINRDVCGVCVCVCVLY